MKHLRVKMNKLKLYLEVELNKSLHKLFKEC